MHTNRLAHEKSPYLLQHQYNPVDWYPWSTEAFDKAQREKKPIFLSVGYSTCHWCHVMERESFENEAIARLLNEHFVSIKVDREERPDVDRVMMTFVQATTGSGGWPMSVFLTPDLKPFVCGTYYPPEDRWGRPGFDSVLRRIAEAWDKDCASIVAHSDQILSSLRDIAAPTSRGDEEMPDGTMLQTACKQLARGFDKEFGGFSNAPKFPRPVSLNLLLRVYAGNPDSENGAHALQMALLTLQKMADGGIHDHLGGGFHRYSVDRFWHIPHFEKMLYDQAQLASTYLDAFQITHEPRYAQVARDVLDYVRRDMTSPEGGFFSAEDADSPLPCNPGEKGEGAFYLWTRDEIESALGIDASKLFNQFYGVEADGNAPAGSDSQGEFTGKNTLIQRCSIEDVARLSGKPIEEVVRSIEESRRVLLDLRRKRPRPHLDDKIITAWNGLMISAFARAAQVLDDATYLESARRAAEFIQSRLFREGHLIRSYRKGPGSAAGFADDYAFVIQGLLDLYEAGAEIGWLHWALQLQQTQDALFLDIEHGGYWSTTGDDPSILLRAKEDYDGAEPSPNSVAALNALRLGQMLDDETLRATGEKTIQAFSEQLHTVPSAIPQLLVALDFALARPKHFVFAGAPLELHPLLQELHAHFIPNKVILFADGGAGQQWLGQRIPFIATAMPADGNPTAYVCEDFACRTPISTVEDLRKTLWAAQNPKR